MGIYTDKHKLDEGPCVICNWPITEQHRIRPGLKYGGKYTKENVVNLCKGHHKLVHKLIRQAEKQSNFNEYEFGDFIKAAKQLYDESRTI